MRLTTIGNDLRGSTNGSVGIVKRRTCKGSASTTVTVDKPCQGHERLVPDLGVRIRCQDLTDISHNLGNADILMTAPLTGEPMKSTLADRGDRIAQRTTKD